MTKFWEDTDPSLVFTDLHPSKEFPLRAKTQGKRTESHITAITADADGHPD